MVNPVFITGVHKSGTSLLRSLLDGHKDLFVIPFETHFLANCGIRPMYPLRNIHQIDYKLNADFISRTKDIIRDYLVNTSDFTDLTEFRLDDKILFEYLDQINPKNNIQDVYQMFCQALYKSFYHNDLTNKRIVEKSVENAELACIYNHLFPGSYFIHIIRNPYANLVSLRKFKTIRNRYPSIVELILSQYINYKYLEVNQRVIENYYVIKYEDLISNPEESMVGLSNFLDIQFDPILLKTTTLNKPWRSNSVYGTQSYEISTLNMNKWQDEIQPIEIYYVNKLFYEYIGKYNYAFVKGRSFLKPVKNEYLKTYVRNRLFKLYLNNFA